MNSARPHPLRAARSTGATDNDAAARTAQRPDHRGSTHPSRDATALNRNRNRALQGCHEAEIAPHPTVVLPTQAIGRQRAILRDGRPLTSRDARLPFRSQAGCA